MASSGSARRKIVKKDDVDALLAYPKADPNWGVRQKRLVVLTCPPQLLPLPERESGVGANQNGNKPQRGKKGLVEQIIPGLQEVEEEVGGG